MEEDPHMHGQVGPEDETEMEDPISEEQLAAVFKLVDKDGDGKVKIQDFLPVHQASQKKMVQNDRHEVFEGLDTDKNGKVSLDEMYGDSFTAKTAEQDPDEQTWKKLEMDKFKVADSDGDGSLNEEEVMMLLYPDMHPELLEIQVAHTLKEWDQDGDAMVDLNEYVHRGGDPSFDQEILEDDRKEFKVLDKNGDGKLDQKELVVHEQALHYVELALQETLADADADSDGFMTLDELKQIRDKLAGTQTDMHLKEWVEQNEL